MRNSEDSLQRTIVSYIRAVAPTHVCFSVPNGGFRIASEAQRLKLTGVLAGVPDLVVLGPGGQAHFIEVKFGGGVLSQQQRDMLDRFMRMGVPYCVARSVEDVRKALQHWKIETREATQ